MTARRALSRAIAAAAALALGSACHEERPPGGPFRLGWFPNVTHAQALVGLADGTFDRVLGGRVQARAFNAGPAAMEALLGGDLDATYVGPGPAVIAHLRTGGESPLVIAGVASGGAVLVVRDATSAKDLAGERVASPQLGNTQDIALRTWLRANGLADLAGPHGAEVTPLPNTDILAMFARGELAGAWVAEPWGARLVAAGGKILVDERALWKGGRFPAAVLAVSRSALERRRPEVAALLRAHVALTRRWRSDRIGFARAANAALARVTGKALPDAILRDAFSRVEPTSDPLDAQLAEIARRAQALGYAPPGDPSRMVERSLLDDAER